LKYRKLRIAWSMGWGIVAVLLIALWMRSYSLLDDATYTISDGAGYKFISLKDEILATRYPSLGDAVTQGWYHRTGTTEGIATLSKHRSFKFLCFAFGVSDGWPYLIVVPTWFTVGLASSFAIAPWITWLRWRFSLRTLLIATTLVAIALTLVVYTARN
jgi:hypothetical protein